MSELVDSQSSQTGSLKFTHGRFRKVQPQLSTAPTNPRLNELILVCLCGWVHTVCEVVCICVYGDQKTISGIMPSAFHLLFETRFFIGPAFHQEGQDGWPVSSRYPPVSAFYLTILGTKRANHHIQLFMWGLGIKISGSQAYKASSLLTKLSPQPKWTGHNLSSTSNHQ